MNNLITEYSKAKTLDICPLCGCYLDTINKCKECEY